MSNATSIRAFQRRLLRWYAKHQRPLPWRRTRDPYKILVSEIMLQQTQVDRVIPKYHEWLAKYPTVRELAQAPLARVKHTWRPLGYNIRPVRLRNIARQVVREHRGRIPDSYDGLIAMDGIGRYTAGAVLSFAFEQDAPILDTNVERLLSRYFGIPGTRNFFPNGNPKGKKYHVPVKRKLWDLAAAVIPKGQGYTINQAMMDFGAMVCVARKPLCHACVLRKSCRSYPWSPANRSRGSG